jgi:demethylmenaquinone methyltransferase/2-methoxy-6-polyprenyl-1,4-benzoquinol methylase
MMPRVSMAAGISGPSTPPPPRLSGAFVTPAAKRRYVRRLFGTIAERYDLITRLLSFGRDQRWKARLIEAAHLQPGMQVLDLACGPGDLAYRAAAASARVVGLDLAAPMIQFARRKPGARRIGWLVGDMGSLPVTAESFDVVTTGYGLRNVPDLPQALTEIHRVLRPGGRLCALDFDRPASPAIRAMYLAYLTLVGSALGWLLHRDPDTYRYIPASIRRYPGARGVVVLLEAAGFHDVTHIRLLGGLMALHVARKSARRLA